ncbi:hypothetical protein CLAFUW4_14729 [Fulvia fulva]|uniref:F-box domain-containing protein n=1 Tax=Passalora fulva TaxID=5499 RepID=A0A9Q8PME0_PASFU|nr:uncharacterized protein CLAFUR5_14556 [Fulvia fulva]KAK4609294.1 hypothetical protein CLAFUR4_14721 [Fulvia fulva]KAK4609752.1 hypothetical protein CLAFUR0_14721 [Fulvia fulva]UJO25289.1 hypothetical protein CLAFUR5_14556 [Fulvia fulva]WPV22814.1 hypothetical protein CLAFUW4_14729 [Fulvia fulva]WPV37905.1 hypothetical protein CLAFUW7_14730 [Fulvia fulva]
MRSTDSELQQATLTVTPTGLENTAALSAFPAELVEQIAEHTATRADLKALRLICRNIASKTQRVYARRLFEQQAYFLNCLESIEIGLALSKHHAFAPFVKEICFLVEDVRYLKSSMSPRRKQHKSTAQANTKRARCLHELLSNFKNCGNLKAVKVIDMKCPGPRPVKMPDVDWRAKYRGWDCWGIMSQSPVKTISSAMPRGMKLDAFCTDARKWNPNVASLDYIPFFETLQHLDLRVSNADYSPNLAHAIAGSRIPAAARRLKSLRIAVHRFEFERWSRHSTPGLIELLIEETMPCLDTLVLEGSNARCQDMFEFVKRHRILKEVVLHNVFLHHIAAFLAPDDVIETFMANVFPGFDAEEGHVYDRVQRDRDLVHLTLAAFNVNYEGGVRVTTAQDAAYSRIADSVWRV